MRAFEISQYGAPEVLKPTVCPIPNSAKGEVLIRVAAFGINRPDVLQRRGFYTPPAGASLLPGLELSGHIEAVDENSQAELSAAGFKIGDAVCALVAGGGYAEYCVAPIAQCLPVPQGLSLIEAASLPETFFTVYSNLFLRAGLKAGETVLIHGGSSGIGVTAIQLAKAAGARVIVTVGNAEKATACLALGADAAINYKTHDFVAEVLAFTANDAATGASSGVDVVIDMVAGDYLNRNLEVLKDDGRLVIIALQGGASANLDMSAVIDRKSVV